jgi:hypothetical protein
MNHIEFRPAHKRKVCLVFDFHSMKVLEVKVKSMIH